MNKINEIPWLFGSGRFSRATKCITVVFPRGNCKAEDKKYVQLFSHYNDFFSNMLIYYENTPLLFTNKLHGRFRFTLPFCVNFGPPPALHNKTRLRDFGRIYFSQSTYLLVWHSRAEICPGRWVAIYWRCYCLALSAPPPILQNRIKSDNCNVRTVLGEVLTVKKEQWSAMGNAKIKWILWHLK